MESPGRAPGPRPWCRGDRGDLAPPPPGASTALPAATTQGLFSLLTLVRLAESTLSGACGPPGDLLFSKLENQFLCLEMASFALIFLSGLSGAAARLFLASTPLVDAPFLISPF